MKANPINWLLYSPNKMLTLRTYMYSFWFWWQVKLRNMDKFHRSWGEEGKESPEDETDENYMYAQRVQWELLRVCKKTSWESKCLVRALTGQKLLKKQGIHSTLYLGCMLDGEKMVAHAWLRVGKLYVSGGNGEGYATVDRFYM